VPIRDESHAVPDRDRFQPPPIAQQALDALEPGHEEDVIVAGHEDVDLCRVEWAPFGVDVRPRSGRKPSPPMGGHAASGGAVQSIATFVRRESLVTPQARKTAPVNRRPGHRSTDFLGVVTAAST
jgi:hypothetical protein